MSNELRFWGFSLTFGLALRRRFRGTAEEAQQMAQKYANERQYAIDYWDEADRSHRPGQRAESLVTVEPSIQAPIELH